LAPLCVKERHIGIHYRGQMRQPMITVITLAGVVADLIATNVNYVFKRHIGVALKCALVRIPRPHQRRINHRDNQQID